MTGDDVDRLYTLIEKSRTENREDFDSIKGNMALLRESVKTHHNTLFGAASNDDTCVLARLSRMEKTFNWLMEKGWRFAMILLTIIFGLMGTGGILSQVLEGIWKRQDIIP